jgi:hypothetical protein
MLTQLAIAVTASAALVLGLAPAAIAAPSPMVPASAVPTPHNCLSLDWHRKLPLKQEVIAKNTCGFTLGFRVINRGPGMTEKSPCIAVAPQKKAGWKWTLGRKYIGSELCNP